MYLTGLVDFTGQLEDTLSGGGLTRVYVGEDTNVSVLRKICHNVTRLAELKFRATLYTVSSANSRVFANK